jgi:hypothetical protein
MPFRAVQLKPMMVEEKRKCDAIVYLLLFAGTLFGSIISSL